MSAIFFFCATCFLEEEDGVPVELDVGLSAGCLSEPLSSGEVLAEEEAGDGQSMVGSDGSGVLGCGSCVVVLLT